MLRLKIGILGFGHYGRLGFKLVRRFTTAEVVACDPHRIDEDDVLVPLADLANCTAIVFAVPMEELEAAVTSVLRLPDLRSDTIFVNVCSDQTKSGESMARLAGGHPHISVHSPWGPEAYRSVSEVVSALPAIVVTASTLSDELQGEIETFMSAVGFRFAHMDPVEHDKVLAGQQMYITHLFAQILHHLGFLDMDVSRAPISFQLLVQAARLVRNDTGLFFELWKRVSECHVTFNRMRAIVVDLERQRDVHVNGK